MTTSRSSEKRGEIPAWSYRDGDRELFERELETFIPSYVFDSHAHLYEKKHSTSDSNEWPAGGPDSVGWKEYQNWMRPVMPGRSLTGLFFGFPVSDLAFASANDFVSSQVELDSDARALMLVHPEMDPDCIREVARRKGFVGFKCYHVWSNERPTYESSIEGYLPEQHVRIAHEEGFAIVLHIVRARALADSGNQQAIRGYALKYPDAQFILAHAARGFNPYHTIEGIDSLRGLGNVWFDTSAVTESGALEAVIRTFGTARLLYGSDFPISHQRGRCVAFGDSFLWLSADNVDFPAVGRKVEPTLVAIEALRSLKLACFNMSVTDTQLEAIFYSNAAAVFKLAD